MKDPYIYLLTSKAEYKKSLMSGELVRDSLKTEGFIHASPKEQLTRVANKHYTGFDDILVLVVESGKVKSEIKWEPAAGSLYPHIYGPLNTDSIIETINFSKNEDLLFDISF